MQITTETREGRAAFESFFRSCERARPSCRIATSSYEAVIGCRKIAKGVVDRSDRLMPVTT
jgi:hypothetical protein